MPAFTVMAELVILKHEVKSVKIHARLLFVIMSERRMNGTITPTNHAVVLVFLPREGECVMEVELLFTRMQSREIDDLWFQLHELRCALGSGRGLIRAVHSLVALGIVSALGAVHDGCFLDFFLSIGRGN